MTANEAKRLRSSAELQAKMEVSHKMVGMDAVDDKRLFLCSLSKRFSPLSHAVNLSFFPQSLKLFLSFPVDAKGYMPKQCFEHVATFFLSSYNSIKLTIWEVF